MTENHASRTSFRAVKVSRTPFKRYVCGEIRGHNMVWPGSEKDELMNKVVYGYQRGFRYVFMLIYRVEDDGRWLTRPRQIRV